MDFFKKIFSSTKKEDEQKQTPKEEINLPLDEMFVDNFLKNEGKFLYCTTQEEVNQNLKNILLENNWETVLCTEADLSKLLFIVESNSTEKQENSKIPFFTYCEQLIAENGSILFSSNQISETKLKDLPIHFVVFAKTSQIVKDRNEALSNIKRNYKKNIPSNISSVKNYNPNKKSDDFMEYGNNNSKNLYLLLLEDL
jgi:L-lactate utilization protein LutC